MERGKLIVFEGPDGIGKSTVARALFDHLKSGPGSYRLLGFPGNEEGTLGRHVYDLHHNPEHFDVQRLPPVSLQLLHVAAHVDAIEHQIAPAIESGITIILDRYWWSTWVYGTIGGVDKAPLETMINVELYFWRNLHPALLCILDRDEPLTDQISRQRFDQLRQAYRDLVKTEEGKYPIRLVRNDGDPLNAVDKLLNTGLISL